MEPFYDRGTSRVLLFQYGDRRVHQTGRCDPGAKALPQYIRVVSEVDAREWRRPPARFAVHHTEFANGQIAPAIAYSLTHSHTHTHTRI